MTFDEVIGQQEVKQRLVQLVDEQRLPHALMLCGPQGSGKLALATAFGCYLLSPTNLPKGGGLKVEGGGTDMFGEPIPLEEGRSNPLLENLQHPDLHFTYPTIKLPSMSSDCKPVSADFANEWHELIKRGLYFSMNDWMQAMGGENQQAIITVGESDALIHKLSLKSSQGGYKVSIIWLPERMNQECANKLLKLIEEPPQKTVFIMVSQEPDKLLETIRSRVQRIDVKKIDDESMAQALMERRGLGEDTARRVARRANGNWLKALEEIEEGSEKELFLDMFKSLMRLAYTRKVNELKRWSESMAGMGREKQKRFLEYFLLLVRENFMYNFHQEELCYMTQAEEDFAKNFARYINEANVIALNNLANRAIRDIGQNANAKIVFFDFALQMIMLLIQK